MPHQMQGFIFVRVVGLLEHGHIVHAALVEIPVFVHIDRINLDADIPEILPGNLHRLADIVHIGPLSAFAGENQNLFHPRFGDDLHLMLHLFQGELLPADIVIAVESAVDTVILAVVGDIDRREDVDRIAEMVLRLLLRPSCHPLQEGGRRRRKQRLEILDAAGISAQGPLHVPCGVGRRIIILHLRKDPVLDIRFNNFHALHIGHVVRAEGRVLLQTVLSGQCLRRKCVAVYKINLGFFIHRYAVPLSLFCPVFPVPRPVLLSAGIRSAGQRRFRPGREPVPYRSDMPFFPPQWPAGRPPPWREHPRLSQWPCWP